MKINNFCIKAALFCCGALLLAASSAFANPHAGQSSNVVIIGGTTLDTAAICGNNAAANSMGATAGGCLPVSGASGELGDFTFTPMAPAAVSAANLATYDTAVLNVASSAMACNTGNLSAQAQADLVAFVGSGKKLIIFDSECPTQDYSWLPYPFTTANPGALGATGTLSVIENNLLSTMVGDPTCVGGDPHCINVSYLGTSTDAVGDMNVMTTFDPNWCLDMSGTNAIGITGPVHTYAKYPAGTDTGLILYNGLDQDYQDFGIGDTQLRKIWVQELQQPFNPSNLPCGVPVVGIALTPATGQNEVGTDHIVTAKLSDLLNNPQSGIIVSFSVTSGPNVGSTGICSVNADCSTDVNGIVNFTYKGAAGVGIDEIKACFNNQAGTEICSQPVTKEWIITNKAPDCSQATPSVSLLWPPNHKFVPVNILGVTDPDGDPVTINITSIRQDEDLLAKGSGNTTPDGKGVGTSTAEVRAERVGDPKVPGNGRLYYISFTATDDAVSPASCSGVVSVGVPHDQGQHATPVGEGPIYDSTQP